MLPGAVTRTRVLVTRFAHELDGASLEVATALRAAGVEAECWLGEPGALGKQFKYAAGRGIPFAVVLGPDEVAAGVVALKDLRDSQQRAVPLAELAAAVRG